MRKVASGCLCLFLATGLLADPCGMVPPILAGGGPPITRVGLQKTYVFYRDGVESIVLRPAFSGKAAEFGMLIPFPSPPALRKLPDDIFAHVAAAVDPPEVALYPGNGGWGMLMDATVPTEAEGGAGGGMLRAQGVRVLKEEAVGMYEVAVLEAGSAAALKRWMDDHGFVYPEGMDGVCEEYVAEGWCFVAVKARVGKKAQADPRPGMRDGGQPGLAPGESFDGAVQAMGFRFETPELVVPMRLSAFNEGELHNVVYILAEQRLKIIDIPEELVVRQLPGTELLRNITRPLPLRLMWGSLEDLTLRELRGLPEQRDPEARNGLARALFASDLGAVAAGRLANPHEEHEKGLLSIGERLGLRGASVDSLHREALKEQAEIEVGGALQGLAGMQLTVVDGIFEREVLARQNLRFTPYTMPEERNQPSLYHAMQFGPFPEQGGVLVSEADLQKLGVELDKLLGKPSDPENNSLSWQGACWLLPLLPLMFWLRGRRQRRA